jgi:hypothetical protein
MKKTLLNRTAKLRLNREAIRTLDSADLIEAVGGRRNSENGGVTCCDMDSCKSKVL